MTNDIDDDRLVNPDYKPRKRASSVNQIEVEGHAIEVNELKRKKV